MKHEQGVKAGGLRARACIHREPGSATTTSCRPLLLDEVYAAGAPTTPLECLEEDGPTRTKSTRSTVSRGCPGAWLSTATLEHRQHLRADELIMLPLETFCLRCGTKNGQ